MSLKDFLNGIKSDEGLLSALAHHAELPAIRAKMGDPTSPLPPELESGLADSGVTQLYTHQATAVNLVREGKNIVAVTPPARGERLPYKPPLL